MHALCLTLQPLWYVSPNFQCCGYVLFAGMFHDAEGQRKYCNVMTLSLPPLFPSRSISLLSPPTPTTPLHTGERCSEMILFVDTILASLYRRVSMLKSARVSVYRPCRPGTGLLASLYRPCPPGTGLFASLYRPCPSGTDLLRTTTTALSDDDDDEDGEDEVSLNYLDADSDDDDEAEITGLDKLRLFAMQEGQRWPVTTPPKPLRVSLNREH